jgi:hypothetical protein
MNEYMSPDFEKQLHDLLATPDAEAEFVNGLRSKLIERNNVKTFRRGAPRLAWGIAIVLIALVIGLLAFSPRVVEAMRRLLGYIPGVGYVEKGMALRVLSGPVTVQKQGLKLTMEQGAADSQRTVLLAQVEGYPKGRPGAPTCKEPPQLVSADGTVQKATEITGSSDEHNDAIVFVRYEFGALPAKPLDATLEIPCLLFDADYKGWSIPLHFQVAKGTDQVIPVIELPTARPIRPASPSVSTPAAESAPAGFSIVLNSVAELTDGYVLSGSYQWSDARIDPSAVVISDSNIVDAKGQNVPYQAVDGDVSALSSPQQIPFAYQITGKDFVWPLNIVVNAISLIQPGQGTFQFDPGPNPQPGQTWNVNIDVPVGPHIIHVETIQLTGNNPNSPNALGYGFSMTSDPTVASATVEEVNPITDCKGGCGGGGGGGIDAGPSGTSGATGPFYYGTMARGYLPAGVKTFVISNMAIFFKGPWQASWQPSAP